MVFAATVCDDSPCHRCFCFGKRIERNGKSRRFSMKPINGR